MLRSRVDSSIEKIESSIEMKRCWISFFMAWCICASILYTYRVYQDAVRRPIVNILEKSVRLPHSDRATTEDLDLRKLIQLPPFENPHHRKHVAIPERLTDYNMSSEIAASPSNSLGGHASAARPVHEGEIPFDPYRSDTMVYIHIQKTGGSEFLEHLVTAQITEECFNHSYKKVRFPASKAGSLVQLSRGGPRKLVPLCKTSHLGGWTRDASYLGNGSTVRISHEMCPRDWEHPNGETWLVSEKTTAWNCGLHAFYTDFKRCLRNSTNFNLKAKKNYEGNGRVARLSRMNRFHYVVILRHPLLRYVSEYLHVSRGACWERSFVCDGEVMQNRKPPPFGCPEHFHCDRDRATRFIKNLTLERFTKCQDSWSVNRMTVSLADHEDATCWNKTRYTREERDQLLLASAKSNLLNFSYFGISEFLSDSGLLFEKTFGVLLRDPIDDLSPTQSQAGKFLKSLKVDKEMYKKIIDNNRLDLELYKYALDIFKSRMRTIAGRQLDPNTLNYIHTLNDMMFSL